MFSACHTGLHDLILHLSTPNSGHAGLLTASRLDHTPGYLETRVQAVFSAWSISTAPDTPQPD